jgi:rod shape-determining protein MreC
VVGCLVVLALVLISLSFRSESGGTVSGFQSAGASALRPFAVGLDRVAQPFRDGYHWADGLFGARSEAERLRAENRALRQRLIQSEFARRENAYLRRVVHFMDGPRFPDNYNAVNAEVISRPAGAFTQSIVVAAGANQGVHANDPVVTVDGLAGIVTRVSSHTARVELVTDQEFAASAIDVRTGATGVVRHARGTPETLVLDRVRKADVVKVGDEVVTAGWRTPGLSSLFPKGILIGEITSFGLTDTDLYQQVQVDPAVDFGSLDAVIVLVPKDRANP